MASTRRKSAAIALAVIGIAGLSLAAAATLDVNGGTLQAGTSLDAACDTDGVTIAYTTSVVVGAYTVSALTIKDVEVACAGKTIEATIVKPNGTTYVLLTGQVVPAPVSPATAVDVTWTQSLTMADIGKVAVIIH